MQEFPLHIGESGRCVNGIHEDALVLLGSEVKPKPGSLRRVKV